MKEEREHRSVDNSTKLTTGSTADAGKQKSKSPRIDKKKTWFRLEVRRSRIDRWGVFALEAIPARRRVIEYTGEKVDDDELNRRGGDRVYAFWLNDTWSLDPVRGGSGAEYINHSCDGNLASYVYGGHIYLSSTRRIEPGEELTYDYHVTGGDDTPCHCGTPKCRGSLNAEE